MRWNIGFRDTHTTGISYRFVNAGEAQITNNRGVSPVVWWAGFSRRTNKRERSWRWAISLPQWQVQTPWGACNQKRQGSSNHTLVSPLRSDHGWDFKAWKKQKALNSNSAGKSKYIEVWPQKIVNLNHSEPTALRKITFRDTHTTGISYRFESTGVAQITNNRGVSP